MKPSGGKASEASPVHRLGRRTGKNHQQLAAKAAAAAAGRQEKERGEAEKFFGHLYEFSKRGSSSWGNGEKRISSIEMS